MVNPIPRHRTYYEGADDGSVLEALAAGGLLPADLELVQKADRQKNPGKDGMIKDIAALVSPVGGAGLSAVAIRDVDDLSTAQVSDWFIDRMNAELPKTTPALQVGSQPGAGKSLFFRIEEPGTPHAGRVVVVSAGLPGGAAATEYGITQFAIDDYVLLLARDRAVYNSVSELKEVSYDLAMKKLSEIIDLMKANQIPIKHTKRLMHLLRAVTGFRASPATFAERLVNQAIAVLGSAGVRSVFLPLLESLEEASKLLIP